MIANTSMRPTEPSLFVIFGGTGDLSRRKLLPALARLWRHGDIRGRIHVLAVTPETNHDDASFRQLARQALSEARVPDATAAEFERILHFQPTGKGTPDDFRLLAGRIAKIREDHGLPDNTAYYLALPPAVMPGVVTGLDSAGLTKSNGGWVRVVIEKPYGHDRASAAEMTKHLHRYFEESQIYRIDHYLGKDTVQNLLVFRFANAIFESLWNRERVDCIEILVAEELGVGTRAGYYDTSGALRDMVQNHLTQLLSLVAMEVPTRFEAESIRYEKIKVLRSIASLDPKHVVRGQYTAGIVNNEHVIAYADEPGVPPGSTTETFIAFKAEVDTWRWKGVPFYLRTGKRLAKRTTEICVRFRDVPISLFKKMDLALDTADVLKITLQPDEGFSLLFDVKTPGSGFKLQRIPLSFRYKDMFEEIPEAYETLLLDVLEGDQTLFVHADETSESWKLYTPLLVSDLPLYPYTAGSWGPKEADHFGIPEHDRVR
jgi:glucose-6-phosphate 1-dehydrogenase